MSLSLLLLCFFAVALLALVALSLWATGRPFSSPRDPDVEGDSSQHHVTFFPQVRQAMAREDYAFLSSRGSRKLARRVRAERRAIALEYLFSLRQDFLRLWRLARVIAGLSSQVAAAQELARLHLVVGFLLRYELIRLGFVLGFAPLPELGSLNDLVGKLALRMEAAMQDLGEQSALAAKFASSLD